eukprot:scaffold126144_cov24-Attheya_sp.AAC.1
MMFTDEAVDMLLEVLAINDDDFGRLSRIFVDGDRLERIKRQLYMNYGIGMPGEEEMDQVRMALNRMGGNFPLITSK